MGSSGRVGLAERMIAVRGFEPFHRAAEADVRALAGALEEARFAAGDVVLRETDVASALFFVREGSLTVSYSRKPTREPALVGVTGLVPLFSQAMGARIVASEPTEVLFLERSALVEAMEENFAVLSWTLQHFATALLAEQATKGLGFEGTDRVYREVFATLPRERLGRLRPVDGEGEGEGEGEATGARTRRAQNDFPTFGNDELDLAPLERILALRSLPYLRRLNVNALATWARTMNERRHAPGAVLWENGDRARDFLVAIRGTVEEIAEGGTVIGEAPQLLGAPEAIIEGTRFTRCVARTEVLALHTTVESLLDVCEDHVEVGLAIVSSMATLLQRLYQQEPTVEADPI